jgi:pyruvate kinase
VPGAESETVPAIHGFVTAASDAAARGTRVPASPAGSLFARSLARRTKIVATIGPASRSVPVLRRLLQAGLDVARLNFSHGTREEHAATIRAIRRLSAECGAPVAILQDLQGPKIRVGRLPRPLRLDEGAEVVIRDAASADAAGARNAGARNAAGAGVIPIPFPGLARRVRPGTRILLRDGSMELAVLEAERREIRCRVVRGGMLGEHQGVAIPGLRLEAEALTPKDAADMRFGLAHGVDYVALSFVRRAEDVRRARGTMRRLGRTVPIVAKLEKGEAIADLGGIVDAADAVMVARGDLGVELPPEQVPLIQKRIIRLANERGIPVITATQMLESMVRQDRPTRAETSDVANAILDGSDAVMLSEETAAGRHPVEAVAMMARIARAVEGGVRPPQQLPGAGHHSLAHAVAAAACGVSAAVSVDLIAALTASGRTARLVSQLRPGVPIIACTEDAAEARRLALYWGVRPLVLRFQPNTEAMIRALDAELIGRRLAPPGARVVVLGSVPIMARGRTNFLHVHSVRRGGREESGRRARSRVGPA